MSEKKKDYYKILGLEHSASKEKIKDAWRGLVKKYHSDKGNNSKEAEQKMQDINEAYEVLFNDKKRLEYDNSLSFEEEFKERGWTENDGRVKDTYGNFGGRSDIRILIHEIKKQNENLKHKSGKDTIIEYLKYLSLHARYENNKEITHVFHFGFNEIAIKAIKEKLIHKELVMKIIHHTLSHSKSGNTNNILIHIQGMLKLRNEIEFNLEHEFKRNRPYILRTLWKYITQVVIYNKQYVHYNINPAHIYGSIQATIKIREQILMSSSDIKAHNHKMESRLYGFFENKLSNAIHSSNVQSAKWYLDMIKYICHLLGNSTRFAHITERMEKQLKHNVRPNSFEYEILNYLKIKINETENQFKHKAPQSEKQITHFLLQHIE